MKTPRRVVDQKYQFRQTVLNIAKYQKSSVRVLKCMVPLSTSLSTGPQVQGFRLNCRSAAKICSHYYMMIEVVTTVVLDGSCIRRYWVGYIVCFGCRVYTRRVGYESIKPIYRVAMNHLSI